MRFLSDGNELNLYFNEWEQKRAAKRMFLVDSQGVWVCFSSETSNMNVATQLSLQSRNGRKSASAWFALAAVHCFKENIF